jgi:phosphatidylglycerophosphate synthase
MISNRFKSRFSAFFKPLALLLRRIGVNANHLTLVGFLLSRAAAAAFARGSIRLGGVVLLLAGLSDVLDGSVARNSGTSSRFGAFIDSVSDRYSEFFVFSGLLFWFHREEDTVSLVVLLMALLGSMMVSYTRARAESIIDECQVGLMERPERVIILIVFAILGWIRPALWILAVGANLTALRRIVHTWKKTREAG